MSDGLLILIIFDIVFTISDIRYSKLYYIMLLFTLCFS